MDNFCDPNSEISKVCNVVGSHCLQAMKIVPHHDNGRFDWLISGHHSVNPVKETFSVLCIVSQLSECLKLMAFREDVFKNAVECKYLSEALETFYRH